MNKIEVRNDLISLEEIDDKIEIIKTKSLISSFKIVFKESTDLEIVFEAKEETKLSFEYEVLNNVNVNLFEIRTGLKTKIQYKYNIKENARLYLYRLNKASNVRECDFANLNGENSHIEFNLRTLSSSQEKYDIYVSHNNCNTSSVVNNVGIALNGSIIFNVTGEISKGNKKSYLDQNNHIVTFNPSKNQINPNLLVEEFDVEANHNAVIGAFDDNTLFYFMSRGINEKDAIKLLCEGLICSNLKENYSKEKILDNIQEYWR